jgi:Protein of unknown function (DUF3631)
MTAESITAELLDDVVAFVRRYVVLSREQATAVALWTVHTHSVDALGITPYLAITSAEKSSGKTLLLEVLEHLVAKPWLTGSVSAATLARKIHQVRPTLLLDESDAAFKGDREYAETLRGVLNSGFKASGSYSRCVGANGTNLKVEDFKTFCAKAIAGIGQLPDTVADRSIRVRLQKKLATERVERKRERTIAAEAASLRERLEQWAEESDDRLARLDLAPLDELGDRAADIWEPLLGIAYLAGEKWFVRARAAAVALSGRDVVDDESLGVQLLEDIRAVFDEQGTDKLASATLGEALAENEESPWGEWHGKPITAHGIARLLKRFEIRPRQVRLDDATTLKGYHREQFEDAWNRYLPPLPPIQTETPKQPAPLSGKPADPNRNTTPLVPVTEGAANPHGQRDVSAVSVQKGGTGGEDALGADAVTGEEREQLRRIDRRTRERFEAPPDPDHLEADRRLFAEVDEIGDDEIEDWAQRARKAIAEGK